MTKQPTNTLTRNIKNIRETGSFNFSQFEVRLEDGFMFYIRGKHGYLSVQMSDKPTDDIGDCIDGIEIYDEKIGYDKCGKITKDEVIGYINKGLKNYTMQLNSDPTLHLDESFKKQNEEDMQKIVNILTKND